ncbi:hypothetical protein [Streptomyces sp. SCL15-4]|uniref:hypothetical protein n=1 Tax=Streptomyces sp. SCL15-4 TaxID=2967221 RepID=UPI002966FC72|nr:hypothetical protein [Streptomyces sp. SCL15-4]
MTGAPDGSLSPEQYQRLEAIGSALRYGEYVVDSVKYLVERAWRHGRRSSPGSSGRTPSPLRTDT